MNSSIKPLVSVFTISYNQGQYLRQTIEGVLMQRCNFDVEYVIRDDHSTDNSKEICMEYAQKHPMIRLLPSDTNIGMMANYFEVLKAVKGKYLAWCDGDDYWIDPNKLQKQVDFLEANSDYGLVHGNCHYYFENKEKWNYHANAKTNNHIQYEDKEQQFRQLINSTYRIVPVTAVFRKELLDKADIENMGFLMLDTRLWLQFSQLSKFKYFDDVFSVYRILSNSVSNSIRNYKKLERYVLSGLEMRIYYLEKYGYSIEKAMKKRYNRSLMTYKLFDTNYSEMFPLINPSLCNKLKSKMIGNAVFKPILHMEYLIIKYLKAIRSRISSQSIFN